MNIKDNPFYILGASPRDSKQVLHEKAEDKAFELPEDVCRNAERILLNPKKRLEAEVSWFPGLSPKKTSELIVQILDDSKNLNYDSEYVNQLDGLIGSNALALYLSNIPEISSSDLEVINIIVCDFCKASSIIDLEKTYDLINADRVASGFPEISDIDDIQHSLDELQKLYKKTLHSFLDTQDSHLIVKCLTGVIEESTDMGQKPCPWPLLDSIITDYETDVISFFEKQESVINNDISRIRESLSKGTNDYAEPLRQLEEDVMTWDLIAQPIQVLYKSRGQEHKRSSELALMIRNLALESYNRYDLIEISKRLSTLLSQVFAEVPLVFETATDDIAFLSTQGNDSIIIKRIRESLKVHEKLGNYYTTKEQMLSGVRNCIVRTDPLIDKMNNKTIGRNIVAGFILQCVIDYVNRSHDFDTGIYLMDSIRSFITDKELMDFYMSNYSIIQRNQSVSRNNNCSYTHDNKPDDSYPTAWIAWVVISFFVILVIIGSCAK